MKHLFTLSLFSTLIPGSVHAAESPTSFATLVASIVGILGNLAYFVIALMVVAFIWGIAKGWILGGHSEDGVKEGKDVFLYGLIVLVVVFTFWGILRFLRSLLS